MRRWSLDHLLFVIIGVILAALTLPPLFFMVQTSLFEARGLQLGSFTLEHYRRALSAAGGISLTWNTFVFATGSALLALTLGGASAWIAERTNAPGRQLPYVAAFIAFGTPGIVQVIGWIQLLGPRAGFLNVWAMQLLNLEAAPFNVYSMAGMILIEGILWTPLVFLLMATPFRLMDPSLEEAAYTSGADHWQVFRRVTLHLALPSVLGVLLLTGIRSFEAFEVPALVGIPANVSVLTTQIYLDIREGSIPRYGEASAYAVLLVAVLLMALYPYHRATRAADRFATVTGKGFRPRVVNLGHWRWVAFLILLLMPVVVLLPILALLWTSWLPYNRPPSMEALSLMTLSNYFEAARNPVLLGSIRNTVLVAVASAVATVSIAVVASWLIVRSRLRGRVALDRLASLPLVFPGIVMGVALLRTYLSLPIPVYGTIWILVIAYTTRFMPFAMRWTHSGILSIHRELEESARTCGAGWFSVMGRVVGPLMLPALFAAWVYVLLHSARELSMALLLSGPGSQVIGVAIWALYVDSPITLLSAFCMMVTAALLVLTLVLQRLASTQELGR